MACRCYSLLLALSKHTFKPNATIFDRFLLREKANLNGKSISNSLNLKFGPNEIEIIVLESAKKRERQV